MNQIHEPLKVCYILSYREPAYIRTQSLVAALRQMTGVRLFTAINSSKGVRRYAETLWQLVKIVFWYRPDIFILGFRGHEIFFAVRLLTAGKILIFDEMMSPSDAVLNERKHSLKNLLLGHVMKAIERLTLRMCQVVITDTDAHRQFFVRTFSLADEKIFAVPVGADESAKPVVKKSAEPGFTVLFYGTFLPLHGIDTILYAAKQLQGEPISFRFIGPGPEISRFFDLRSQLGLSNVQHEAWVDFKHLSENIIPAASLCLGGPFGGTPQARRVITGKTQQFLFLEKPVVIGQIDTHVPFEDKKNCLWVEQAHPEKLAASIYWALSNPEALTQMGRRGKKLYNEHLSVDAIKASLTPILAKTVAK